MLLLLFRITGLPASLLFPPRSENKRSQVLTQPGYLSNCFQTGRSERSRHSSHELAAKNRAREFEEASRTAHDGAPRPTLTSGSGAGDFRFWRAAAFSSSRAVKSRSGLPGRLLRAGCFVVCKLSLRFCNPASRCQRRAAKA